MIRSSGSLAANDVCVRCRVRRSAVSSNPNFDDYAEMSCTMRNWTPTRGRASDAVFQDNGPELLLQPITESLLRLSNTIRSSISSQGGSGVNRRQIWADMQQQEKRQDEKKPQPFSILLKDIVVVDTVHHEAPLYITHASLGYFEISFPSCHSHDVVMAFLANTLPKERLALLASTTTPRTVECGELDVETLTARRMQERVRDESFTEKMRRKVILISHRIEELSASMADCACVCNNNSGDDSPRQSPPTTSSLPTCTFEFPQDLEVEQSPSKSTAAYSVASSCAV